MESFFIFLPSIQKEFPRQVVESTLRGVWEVLQGKIMQDLDHILFASYNMFVSCSLVSTVYVMYIMCFFMCIIKPKVYITQHAMIHTSVRSPHSFTVIFPRAQALPAGHVPLARLLRLTPEDRTFPAPVKAGRVEHECDMLSRPPDLFGSKKRRDPRRCPRLGPVPDIKIP